MDIDEHKVPEYRTEARLRLCSQQLDKLEHCVAHGFRFRRQVLGRIRVCCLLVPRITNSPSVETSSERRHHRIFT